MVKISHLRRFVALADELHFPRAAESLGISLNALYSSITRLEAEVGHPLVVREGTTRLTPAGVLFLDEAKERIAATPVTQDAPPAPAGGKAKANKGIGRTPAVKGQPKPYHKRQGR